jgi:ubiquinone biosynthesis protein Coq4
MQRISSVVKLARGIAAGVRLVKDPERLDKVIAMTDHLVRPEVTRAVVADVSRHEQGARALVERPRLDVDLAALSQLAPGTLGREFADHMKRNDLDPADLPKRPANDPEAFVRAHLFETHDVWHAVTGFDTDVAGELGLQAFYMAQIPSRLAPVLLSGGLLNTLFYAWDDRTRRMDAIVKGWEMGKRAKPFFGMKWGELWNESIEKVRADLNVN